MQSLPEIGDVVDDTYELVSVLGTGGFGAVYRARQLNMDRDVALKLLIASGPKFDEMVKRFRREVMAIRNLTHPNTVRIFDFRDHPDGLLYYTMEALEGVTLKEELKNKGPFSPRRYKRILLQVLKSLSEAHSYSIIHRDLKPANIMLVEMHGEEDFVKVLDFGIAKLMQDSNEEGEEVEELTSAGMLVGTLKYMAPEQIAGEQLGPHTDLYALGLIAVEMLSGESIYSGSGRWEVLRQQVSEEPVDIPTPVRESGLGPVIERCLDKDRRRRYASADEVITDLKNLDDSALQNQSLYVSDGQGGWKPRQSPGTSPDVRESGKQTVEYDELPTMMLDDDAVEFVEDDDATVVTPPPEEAERSDDFPSVPSLDKDKKTGNERGPEIPPGPTKKNAAIGPQGPTKKNAAVGPTKKNAAVGPDGPAPPNPSADVKSPPDSSGPPGPTVENPALGSGAGAVDQTGETSVEDSDGSDGDLEANRLNANRLNTSTTGQWDQTREKKSSPAKWIAAISMVAMLGAGAVVGAWMLYGESEDDAGDGDIAQTGEDQAGETGEADGAADDEQPEVHQVDVDVEDDEITATVYVDDEQQGQTPKTVEFTDQAVLAVRADGFEPFEGLVDGNTSEELAVELEPVEDEEEEPEDDAPDAVAERDDEATAPTGAGAGGPTGGQQTTDSRRDEATGSDDSDDEVEETEEPAEEPDEEPEEKEDEPAEEPDEDEDDTTPDWVDVSSGEEEEEEGGDVPVF